ncbi:hypothetical protein BKA70DRAFT_1293407 [Coprinopsis sp. MPI-PUGE-AT-0042]|nr:hypothetical protein BKA70DRAFT_1293407 [Coprinopsis sp. MPI-PUGE-AT-0042]
MANTEKKDTKDSEKSCPYSFANIFSKKEKDKTSRTFPWKAFAGLTGVALGTFLVLYLSIALAIGYYYALWTVIKMPFKIIFTIIVAAFKFLTLPFTIFSFFKSSPATTALFSETALACTNSMELQGWEVLTLIPGSDGNPAPVKYTLNSPTPHAVSIVDIDFRDTRLDVISNGKYYGSTSDFALNKTEFCGEDINRCISLGYSTGTVVIPGGKQDVEVTWSGKDVFPGTDKIVWGSDRKRRVMWKKDICL